jgi:hypothetical protein
VLGRPPITARRTEALRSALCVRALAERFLGVCRAFAYLHDLQIYMFILGVLQIDFFIFSTATTISSPATDR